MTTLDEQAKKKTALSVILDLLEHIVEVVKEEGREGKKSSSQLMWQVAMLATLSTVLRGMVIPTRRLDRVEKTIREARKRLVEEITDGDSLLNTLLPESFFTELRRQ